MGRDDMYDTLKGDPTPASHLLLSEWLDVAVPILRALYHAKQTLPPELFDEFVGGQGHALASVCRDTVGLLVQTHPEAVAYAGLHYINRALCDQEGCEACEATRERVRAWRKEQGLDPEGQPADGEPMLMTELGAGLANFLGLPTERPSPETWDRGRH